MKPIATLAYWLDRIVNAAAPLPPEVTPLDGADWLADVEADHETWEPPWQRHDDIEVEVDCLTPEQAVIELLIQHMYLPGLGHCECQRGKHWDSLGLAGWHSHIAPIITASLTK